MAKFTWTLDVSYSSDRDVMNLIGCYELITGYPVEHKGILLKGKTDDITPLENQKGMYFTRVYETIEDLNEALDKFIEEDNKLGTQEADWETLTHKQELEYELWKVKQALAELNGETLIVE